MIINHKSEAVRHAVEALEQAEQLVELLFNAARENPDNNFIAKYCDQAEALLYSMSDNLDQQIWAAADAQSSQTQIESN
jgi:hypothetical protein